MNGPKNTEITSCKRKETDGIDKNQSDQQNKKRCIESDSKPTDSITVKSAEHYAQSYEILKNIANEDVQYCNLQLTEATEAINVKGIIDPQKEQISADITFIKRLIQLIDQVSQSIVSDEVSSKCLCLILCIQEECKAIRDAIDEVVKHAAACSRASLYKLHIQGCFHPDKNDLIKHARDNLIILQGIQKKYTPYVICDFHNTLISAKIALFWNDTVLAWELFKKIETGVDKTTSEYKNARHQIREILDEHTKKYPFNKDIDKELIEYHNSVQEIVELAFHISPSASKSGSKVQRSVTYNNLSEFFK